MLSWLDPESLANVAHTSRSWARQALVVASNTAYWSAANHAIKALDAIDSVHTVKDVLLCRDIILTKVDRLLTALGTHDGNGIHLPRLSEQRRAAASESNFTQLAHAVKSELEDLNLRRDALARELARLAKPAGVIAVLQNISLATYPYFPSPSQWLNMVHAIMGNRLREWTVEQGLELLTSCCSELPASAELPYLLFRVLQPLRLSMEVTVGFLK